MTRSSFLLPILAAGAAVAVVAGIVAVGSVRGDSASAGGGSSLQPIRIGAYPSPIAGAAKDSRYVLRGTLPTTPTQGIVWALEPVTDGADRAAVLAKALGLRGDVIHDKQGWTVKDGKAQVRVYEMAGSPWGYSAGGPWGDCGPIPVNGFSLGSGVGCAVSSTSDAGSVTDAQAQQAAAPILHALGLSDAKDALWGDQGMRTLTVDPAVDGLATSGYSTTVEVRSSGVVTAGGWLAPVEHALKAVGTYPLRTAQDAFHGLASMPVPEIACAPTSDCGLNKPVDVTGATYGLMSAWEDTPRLLLVPAWDLAVAGDTSPLIQGALAPKYVTNPPEDDPGSVGSSSSGFSGGSTGSGGSAVPPPAPGGNPEPMPTTAVSGVNGTTPVESGPPVVSGSLPLESGPVPTSEPVSSPA
jgi:hypothetical protein